MEHISSFEGGLNQDISKHLHNKNSYINSRNNRLISDKGQSNGSLDNVKGNFNLLTIPDTFAVYKLNVVGTNATTFITINGQVSPTPMSSISTSTTGQDIYDYISANTAFYTGLGTQYNIHIGLTYVIVFSTTLDPVTISSDVAAIINTTVVSSQTNLEIIGWGKIRDSIVLFTTNDSSSAGGVGQIWKLNYEKSKIFSSPLTSYTLNLLYNNNIKFTKQHPIFKDGGTVGRYETSNIQRIYWTDFFNPLRSFNIEDVNSMAIDPTLIDARSSLTMSVPVLKVINDSGGNIKHANYSLAYRLKSNGGATTAFTPLSNDVKIIGTDGSIFFNIQGGTYNTASNKTITWFIDNIDTDYDRIELAVVSRLTQSQSTPDINIIFEDVISPTGELKYTYTGNEVHIPVTLDEFTILSSIWNVCKSISSRNNILFAANLKNNKFNIDFDSRSYRFDNTGTAKINRADNTTEANFTNVNYPNISTQETFDAINPDQLNSTRTYRFKDDGITIGGSGPNISYTFESFTNNNGIIGDGLDIATPIATLTAGGAVTCSNPYGFNFRLANIASGTYTLNGINYDQNNFYNSFKSPYLESLYKGYQHEEIERFAIVFYDHFGNSTPAKWIGDIEMPRVVDTNGSGTTVNFKITTMDTSYTPDAQVIGILHPIFTVNLSNLSQADKEKISGFSIVKVPRTEEDKSILFAGILNPCMYNAFEAKYYNTDVAETTSFYTNLSNAYTNGAGNPTVTTRRLITMTSPDVQLGSFPGFKSGDKLVIQSKLTPPSIDYNNVCSYNFSVEKLYEQTGITRQELTITGAQNIYKAQDNVSVPSLSSAAVFNNRTKDFGAGDIRSLGEKTLLIETGTAIDYDIEGLTTGTTGKFYAYYKRALTNQYGGRSYTARANNEYMLCNHFERITTASSIGSYTVSLFGGDILTVIYDHQKLYKNWTLLPISGTKYSYSVFFPCETTLNSEWRQGDTVNRTGMSNTGGGGCGSVDQGEAFLLNPVYSAEDYPIQKQYPLPAVFVETEEFDNRVAFSQVKINGELTDNWGIFKPNDFYDVEGIYGPINNLDILRDRMIFFQDKAFGTLSIKPVSLIQDLAGASVQLGTGETIQNHEYVSTNHGCKHQGGMTKSENSFYFFDSNSRKFFKFSIGEGLIPLADIKGLQSYFANNFTGRIQDTDNPIYIDSTFNNTTAGITATYDKRFNSVWFTFHDSLYNPTNNTYSQSRETLSYNESFDCFESFHDVTPSMYINDGTIILTRNINKVNDLYIHNFGNYGTYYGTIFKSILSLIINPHSDHIKVFDNLEFSTESYNRTGTNPININTDTWNRLRVLTEYQNTDYQTLSFGSNVKRPERVFNTFIPRNRVLYTTTSSPDILTDLSATDKAYGERIRDKYAFLDLEYDNLANYSLTTNFIKTIFRISDR